MARKPKSVKVKVAERIAKENGIERILESIELIDCVEVVGRMGGDTITYRIYDNGKIYER